MIARWIKKINQSATLHLLKSNLFSTLMTSVTSSPLIPRLSTSATEKRECTSSEQELKHGWDWSDGISFTLPPEFNSIIQNRHLWLVSASMIVHTSEQISSDLDGYALSFPPLSYWSTYLWMWQVMFDKSAFNFPCLSVPVPSCKYSCHKIGTNNNNNNSQTLIALTAFWTWHGSHQDEIWADVAVAELYACQGYDNSVFASGNTVFSSKLGPAPTSADQVSQLPVHPTISTEGNGRGCEWNSCKGNRLDLGSSWDGTTTVNST